MADASLASAAINAQFFMVLLTSEKHTSHGQLKFSLEIEYCIRTESVISQNTSKVRLHFMLVDRHVDGKFLHHFHIKLAQYIRKTLSTAICVIVA